MMFAGHEDDSLLSWFDHLSQKMQEETSLALLTDTEEGQLQCQEDNESRTRAMDMSVPLDVTAPQLIMTKVLHEMLNQSRLEHTVTV